MRKTELTVTRYQVPGGFYVDVIPQGGEVSFWAGPQGLRHSGEDVRRLGPFAPAERWEALISEDLRTTPPTSGRPGWRTDAAPES